MKKSTIVIAIIVIGLGAYFLMRTQPTQTDEPKTDTIQLLDTTQNAAVQNTAPVNKTETVIGMSVGGNSINAYHYGEGSDELLFVGGIHGGYEWNTALLAFELMDYLKGNPDVIPKNLKVTLIPVLNPDGLNRVVGKTGRFVPADVSPSSETVIAGRFNANTVDLNRNFDCDWQKEGKWQTKTVSGGSEAFSEPESQAVKNYIEKNKPMAAIVWYSAAGGVFASNCHGGVSTETNAITKLFADASGYPAYQSFNFYEITGDMVNWLAKENIPAISVLLTNHTDTEFDKNLKGIKALFKRYTK